MHLCWQYHDNRAKPFWSFGTLLNQRFVSYFMSKVFTKLHIFYACFIKVNVLNATLESICILFEYMYILYNICATPKTTMPLGIGFNEKTLMQNEWCEHFEIFQMKLLYEKGK